jgi:nitrite reductase/ring-hydroxylating ferredoxin subunit
MCPPSEFDTGLDPASIDSERPSFVETPWGPMAIYLVEGDLLCVQAFCPHMDGPLFQGTLSGTSVTCPWHAWRYDLRTCKRIDFARSRSGPGSEALVSCEVSLSPSGTIVLRHDGPAAT